MGQLKNKASNSDMTAWQQPVSQGAELGRNLSEWAARDHQFTPDQRDIAGRALFDIIGCMIGGADDPATAK